MFYVEHNYTETPDSEEVFVAIGVYQTEKDIKNSTRDLQLKYFNVNIAKKEEF